MKEIFVTGGAGYVGCCLIPKLLNLGYTVTVYDILYFGSKGLNQHPNLKKIKGDLRDYDLLKKSLANQDAVIHLACISNDPSFELTPGLSKEINYGTMRPLVTLSKEAGVKRFILASTSSVYGVSDQPNVTEEHPQVPLTDYNKYKGLSEPILLEQGDESFCPIVLRPATVCGPSTRMRFDLSVNILTNHAWNKNKITVFGGSQLRPNIHIDDITDYYCKLLTIAREKIFKKVFNAGYQNLSILEIANKVKKVLETEYDKKNIEIEITESDDLRSYHISSEKIEQELGLKPKKTIEDAVRNLADEFINGNFSDSFDNPIYFNIQTMKNHLEGKRA